MTVMPTNIEIANFIHEKATSCPKWLETIINKPFKDKINQTLDLLKIFDVSEIPLSQVYLDQIRKFELNPELMQRVRQPINQHETVLYQYFGKNITYVQKWDDESQSISSAYYIDSKNNKAVDLLSLDPTINYRAHLTPVGVSIDHQWFAEKQSRTVYLSGNDQFGWGHDMVEEERRNMIAPAHEIGHILRFDVIRKQSLLVQLPLLGKDWADAIRGSIASLYKLLELYRESSSKEEIEYTVAMYQQLRNYDDDTRGSSDERFAALYSLLFARKSTQGGVDLIRAMSPLEMVQLTNSILHSSTL